MHSDSFINNMLEAFDHRVKNLSLECDFKELPEWDSLTSVSVIAMIYAEYNVQVSGDEMLSCNNLHELMSIVGEKQAKS